MPESRDNDSVELNYSKLNKQNEIILANLSHENSSKLSSIVLTTSDSNLPIYLPGLNIASNKSTQVPYKKNFLSEPRTFSPPAQMFAKVEHKINSSSFRQLLPITLCILSFATVLSILLILYMDPTGDFIIAFFKENCNAFVTEIRHQQFRLNMSRDYELLGVSQDDPTLIEFLREIHLKKYPMHFFKNMPFEESQSFVKRGETTSEIALYIGNLLHNKKYGTFIQSLTGSVRNYLTGPLLAETLNWTGTIVEPEPQQYFSLKRQNSFKSVEIIHACVSPNKHPKEVTIYNEGDSEIKITSLINDEMQWFSSRVKCFPLYTLMLAINQVNFDLLSLGVQGHELEILQTLPFEKINIAVITIHLPDLLDSIRTPESNSIFSAKFESQSSLLLSSVPSSFIGTQDKLQLNKRSPNKSIKDYVHSITKFLTGKSYRLEKKFENNYIYFKTHN